MHVLHNFWGLDINTTAFRLGRYSLYLPLLKSSMVLPFRCTGTSTNLSKCKIGIKILPQFVTLLHQIVFVALIPGSARASCLAHDGVDVQFGLAEAIGDAHAGGQAGRDTGEQKTANERHLLTGWTGLEDYKNVSVIK